MYPVGNDEKRFGYWGRQSLRWSPMITAFCSSSSHVIPSSEYELGWPTPFYNRSDGNSFLKLGNRPWLVFLNFCQSLRSLIQEVASFCIMRQLRERFRVRDQGLLRSEFGRGSSCPVKPSEGTADPALSLTGPPETLKPEAASWWHLELWLMEQWHKCFRLLSLGIICYITIDNSCQYCWLKSQKFPVSAGSLEDYGLWTKFITYPFFPPLIEIQLTFFFVQAPI